MGVATRIIYFCAVQKAEEAVIRVPRMQFCSTCVNVLSICVQWASPKTRIPYDFSSYVGSMRHIPKNFRSAALSTATQPW